MRLSPRTIRGQLLVGLIFFEFLLLALVSYVVFREQRKDLRDRSTQRLEYQASVLGLLCSTVIENGGSSLEDLVKEIPASRGVRSVQITDTQGRTIAGSGLQPKGGMNLLPEEKAYLHGLSKPAIFHTAGQPPEAVAPVQVHGETRALVWIYADDRRDNKQLRDMLLVTFYSALPGIILCTLFATLLAERIARPLAVLTQATRKLVGNVEDTSAFPIAVSTANEASDLTLAFNVMVASIAEQRAGLNDTLALLDSMLANAPIGFAFFDQRLRMVRVNQFMAKMNDLPVGRHLGRSIEEIFAPSAAGRLKEAVERVFQDGYAVRDLEVMNEEPVIEGGLSGGQGASSATAEMRSWLANIYPVRTNAQSVRWVGVILVETTDRRRADDLLRKSEKLAATGRLAASIAHEINNPLEAVTNLLYLIRRGTLDPQSLQYAQMAQDEVARMAEITQQMLRFYKQSTKPVLADVCGLVDSVLSLHQRRAAALHIDVIRSYGSELELFCFAGEIRQLLNNLIANAIDAMTPGGGRLLLRVKHERCHPVSGVAGVRLTIADTGTGMAREVRRHIFEPFFTTKEDTGTGLGLWVSAEIIQKHKGTVAIRSRVRGDNGVGGGTVFSIFFPADLEHILKAENLELEASETI